MKVKLVAIAKDESAYFPEWVYHHLKIGVDQVDIHLNNISDFSHLILDKISKNHNVKYYDSDDIRFFSDNDSILGENFIRNNPLQSRVFAKAYVDSSKDFDYIIYLDIDEFLFIDGFDSIKEYISNLDEPELIKIKWLNETCDDESFSFFKKEEIKGYTSNATKCIVKTNIKKIKFQSTHQIITHDNSKRYLEGYGFLDERNKDEMEKCFNDEVFILHRAYRSEKEYVSLLLRGDNISNTELGLKDNRPGRLDRVNIKVKNTSYDNDILGFESFVEDCDIKYDIVIAREFVYKRYNSVCSIMSKLLVDLKQSKKVLRGTSLSGFFDNDN